MKSYVVYHLIHVQTPHQHNPELVITDVPDGVELTEDDVTRFGYLFGEVGSAWCNYVLQEIIDKDKMPADLVAQLYSDSYKTVSYNELINKPFPFQE